MTADPTPPAGFKRSSGASPNIEHELMACEHALHEALGEVDVTRSALDALTTKLAAAEAVIEAAKEMVEGCWEGTGGDRDYNDASLWKLTDALATYRATHD